MAVTNMKTPPNLAGSLLFLLGLFSNLGLSVSRHGCRAPAYRFGAGAPKVISSMRPTVKSHGLSMLFLKVLGVKPLFQKGLAGGRGRAPRAPELPCPINPNSPQCNGSHRNNQYCFTETEIRSPSSILTSRGRTTLQAYAAGAITRRVKDSPSYRQSTLTRPSGVSRVPRAQRRPQM